MLFFYNYAKSLIKCIFIIFAFILICFLFWFSFCFHLQLYAYICYLDFIFKSVLFVQNFIFQIHFYFHIWTNAHIKKCRRNSLQFLFLIWNHPQHFQKSYLLITAKHLVFIDFQTQIIDWIKIVYWFKRQIIYYF